MQTELVEKIARVIADKRYDEIDDIAQHTREQWNDYFWPECVPVVNAIVETLAAAGYAIVVDEAQDLKRGGEVKLHE